MVDCNSLGFRMDHLGLPEIFAKVSGQFVFLHEASQVAPLF